MTDFRGEASPWTDVPRPPRGTRVVLGLSGGVDSAVAAHLLREAGYEVTAVTTRNFCFDEAPFDVAAERGSCCGLEAMESAAEVASDVGVAHSVLDVAEDFGFHVVDDYVREYRSGRTPSPCVRCNTSVRFPRLLAFARRIGATHVATGHYARLVRREDEVFVRRGADAEKDQSYFLHRLPSAVLERLVLPLGSHTKAEVRELARERGIPVAEAEESQELCFVPDGDRRPLLADGARPGEIVHRDGSVLGRHEGIEFYTPGQRRGLGVGGREDPLYVLRLDPSTDRVVVAEEQTLGFDRIHCRDVVLRAGPWRASTLRAQTRYRHGGVGVAAMEHDAVAATMTLDLAEPDRAPAPGQAVVLYAGDVAVGGGTLSHASRRRMEENES